MSTRLSTKSSRSRWVVSAQSVALIAVLAFLAWTASSIGFANRYTTHAARSGQLEATNSAINLNPKDPEAHFMRASILVSDDRVAANAEATQAVALRPRDYVFWLGLAQTRELNNDLSGAIDAATQAVGLAPSYSQPHWRLGNALVRAGRFDEGFRELRMAAASDPALLPSIIDLAWHLSNEDADYVKNAVQPNTVEARIALSNYFRSHGKFAEAVQVIREAGASANDYRQRLLAELVSQKHFADAYQLWATGHGANSGKTNPLFDPSFEASRDFSEPGFGWRTGKSQRVAFTTDSQTSAEGKTSLKIEFNGESEPALALLSQLAMVEPNTRYALKFVGRSDQLVSGGLPVMRIVDADSNNVLGESVLRQQTDDWLEYAIDFAVPDKTSFIEIRLQRQSCSTNPCPIFGTLWLDRFTLQKR